MHRLRASFPELFAAALFVGCAAAIIWDVRGLPPPLFGPIGSGALPRYTGWIVVGLSLAVAAIAIVRPARMDSTRGNATGLAVVLLLVLGYVAALSTKAVDFGLLSTVYLLASIGYLARPRGRALFGLAVVSVGIGFGCDHLFTRVLFIDLP